MKKVWEDKAVAGLTESTRSVSVSPDGGVTIVSRGRGSRGGALSGTAVGFSATEWAEIASVVAQATALAEPLVLVLDAPANDDWLHALRAEKARRNVRPDKRGEA